MATATTWSDGALWRWRGARIRPPSLSFFFPEPGGARARVRPPSLSFSFFAPAPCPDGSYGPTICVVSLRNADLPSESQRTQNGYLVSVLRWRMVLGPKNTVLNAFLRLGHAVGDSLTTWRAIINRRC